MRIERDEKFQINIDNDAVEVYELKGETPVRTVLQGDLTVFTVDDLKRVVTLVESFQQARGNNESR